MSKIQNSTKYSFKCAEIETLSAVYGTATMGDSEAALCLRTPSESETHRCVCWISNELKIINLHRSLL